MVVLGDEAVSYERGTPVNILSFAGAGAAAGGGGPPPPLPPSPSSSTNRLPMDPNVIGKGFQSETFWQ